MPAPSPFPLLTYLGANVPFKHQVWIFFDCALARQLHTNNVTSVLVLQYKHTIFNSKNTPPLGL